MFRRASIILMSIPANSNYGEWMPCVVLNLLAFLGVCTRMFGVVRVASETRYFTGGVGPIKIKYRLI